VEAARRLGVELGSGSLADLSGPFTHISLVNVFSHLPRPQEFFREVVPLLEPGGELLVVTGNGGDIPRADYPQSLSLPDHLIFGGVQHLRTIFEQAGCRTVLERSYRTTLPRPRIEEAAEAGLARLLGRRVGYSGAFRSLWFRAKKG
jgi:SAM-dependent methyltransferase